MQASYSNIYNAEDGVLIATSNFSPQANAIEAEVAEEVYKPELPKPAAWSDVQFLRWTQRCSALHVSVSGLTHAFRISVVNVPTHRTITEAIGGDRNPDPVSWATRTVFRPTAANAPEQPDNRAFYALLYTPNIRGISWWLIQHKAQMGLRYIDQIAVWSDDQEFYNIYVHISTYTP
jgi:hypothetical protein